MVDDPGVGRLVADDWTIWAGVVGVALLVVAPELPVGPGVPPSFAGEALGGVVGRVAPDEDEGGGVWF